MKLFSYFFLIYIITRLRNHQKNISYFEKTDLISNISLRILRKQYAISHFKKKTLFQIFLILRLFFLIKKIIFVFFSI